MILYILNSIGFVKALLLLLDLFLLLYPRTWPAYSPNTAVFSHLADCPWESEELQLDLYNTMESNKLQMVQNRSLNP